MMIFLVSSMCLASAFTGLCIVTRSGSIVLVLVLLAVIALAVATWFGNGGRFGPWPSRVMGPVAIGLVLFGYRRMHEAARVEAERKSMRMGMLLFLIFFPIYFVLQEL